MTSRTLTKLALVAFTLVLGCHDRISPIAPPLDRFYYPTGLAVRHEPPGCAPGSPGCRTQLLVASSNWDLAYDVATGGTILAVDVDEALARAALPGAVSPLPAPVLGGVRIGSLGGELAIADQETCSTWTGNAQALVTSRSQRYLYRVDVSSTGALACGDGCAVPLDSTLADPYGVTVACGSFPPAQGAAPAAQALAFVTYLRAVNAHGWLTQVDLLAAGAGGARTSPTTLLDLGNSPTGSSFYDPLSTRLYVTSRFGLANYAPLRWLDLANPGTTPAFLDLGPTVSGADLRGLVLSTDRQRAYLTVRFYDLTVATTYGISGTVDLAGALLVLDATTLTQALPTLRILDIVPLDRGASEVRAIARPGQRDLVAVTATDDSTLTLYDDEQAMVARTFTLCGATSTDAGAPAPCNAGGSVLGTNPFGLAVEPLSSGAVRLYVGSFDRSWVNLIQIDPAHPAAAPSTWIRIGAERQ